MKLALCRPSAGFAHTFLAGLDELSVDAERRSWCPACGAPASLPRHDFAAWVERLLAGERSPLPNRVPETTWWAIGANGEMLGRINLRHHLNEALLREGGHVGFIVRPSARRRGVATAMLRELLATDAARAIGQLLLTCDEDNLGSEKAIRNNGGVLQDIIDMPAGMPRHKRFWITVGPPPEAVNGM